MSEAATRPVPDLSRAALIVADVQRDYLAADGFLRRSGPLFSGPGRMDETALAAMTVSIATLAARFRAAGRPVIWARTAFRADMIDCAWAEGWADKHFGADRGFLVESTPGAGWIDGLAPGADDIVLTRTGHSAFPGTALDRILNRLGVETLLLAGGPVSAALSDTARNAGVLGYSVYLARESVFPPLPSYPLGSSAEPITTEAALAGLVAPQSRRAESRSAYVIIDMQNHFLFPQKGPPGQIDETARRENFARSQELVMRTAALADHLRAQGWPVIWLKTGRRADRLDTAMHRLRESVLIGGDSLLLDGTWGAELAEGLTPAAEDYVLHKRGQSGFAFTPLHRALRNLGVGHCLLAGGAASGCLGATLRDGAALGYRFTVARDAVYPAGSKYIEVLGGYAELRDTAEILAGR